MVFSLSSATHPLADSREQCLSDGIWIASIPKEFKEKRKDGKPLPREEQDEGFIGKWSGLSKSEKQHIAELFMEKYDDRQGFYGSQWHQTHDKYSRKVDKILQDFVRKLESWEVKDSCKECKDKKQDEKLPPPYGLLERLQSFSRELRPLLSRDRTTWEQPMFTSTATKTYFTKRNSS